MHPRRLFCLSALLLFFAAGPCHAGNQEREAGTPGTNSSVAEQEAQVRALYSLAVSHRYRGEIGKAGDLYRGIHELKPQSAKVEQARLAWAEFLLARGFAAEAAEAARPFLKSPWTNVRVEGRLILGEALLTAGDPPAARRELAAAVAEAGTTAETDMLRGLLLLRGGRISDGTAVLKRIPQAPGDTDADMRAATLFRLERLAAFARSVGARSLEEHTARLMVEMDRDYAGGHFALAVVLERRGEEAPALAAYAAARELWNRADIRLPEIAVIRRKLGSSVPAQAGTSPESPAPPRRLTRYSVA